jgi:hypothetical protein
MNDKLQVVLTFVERMKWWFLLVAILVALVKLGSSPAQIVEWAIELVKNISFS